MRRIIKSPTPSTITDALIIDYINRFYTSDIAARIQLFDNKTTYQFQTIPGIDQYNMPLYAVQVEDGPQNINFYPVYQGLESFCSVNGVQVPFYNQKSSFYSTWSNYVQPLNGAATGDGTNNYTIQLPYFPAIPGHVDMQGVIKSTLLTANDDPLFLDDTAKITTAIANIPSTSIRAGVFFTATDSDGENIVVSDGGIFLGGALNTTGDLYGALISPGKAPNGNTVLAGGYTTALNTVNYSTGLANITFPSVVPAGTPINAQCYFYTPGMPRAILFHDNTLTLRNPPDKQYLVSLEGYLSPAAFLASSDSVPFAYMSEYIARGAARKILADTGDLEQFQFYEPLFREQEILVWKRSQRIQTATRTPTLFSMGTPGSLSTNSTQGGL